MAKRYTEEMKKSVVTQFKNGQTANELCIQYGVARSTLFLWAKQYTPGNNG